MHHYAEKIIRHGTRQTQRTSANSNRKVHSVRMTYINRTYTLTRLTTHPMLEFITSYLYFLISYIRGLFFGHATAPYAPRFIPAPVTTEKRQYPISPVSQNQLTRSAQSITLI